MTNAANNGLVIAREPSIWLGPFCGPNSRDKFSKATTGRAPLPANAEPSQSTSNSSVRSTTAAGRSS